MNYKIYGLLLSYSLLTPASLYPADFTIRSSSFNAGGGVASNKDFKNSYTLAEGVVPHGGESSLFKVNSGFINTLPFGDVINRNDLVFNQSVELNEDQEISIQLKGVDLIESFDIGNLPKNGELIGAPPNLVYRPYADYYGSDFFTFYGVINGQKTQDAIVNINIVNINDRPSLEVNDGFVGNIEDEETNISFSSIIDYLNIRDAEQTPLTLIINKVINGDVYSENQSSDDGRYIVQEGELLKWRPEQDAFGEIEALELVVYDGQLYSDTKKFNIFVEGVEDDVVLNKPINDITLEENVEEVNISLGELFYDPDGNQISYFVKDWDNKLLLNATVDGNMLKIELNDNANGRAMIQIGANSNGQLIYDEFEVKVLPVSDEQPFIVNSYWKGFYDGAYQVEMPPPVRFWSFRTRENIFKSKSGNWLFNDIQELPLLSAEPLININGIQWERIYFQDGQSARIQQQTSMDLFVPSQATGLDWAKRNNTYSFVFDIRVKYGVNQPILNTNSGNEAGQSELWVNPFGAVGGQGVYSRPGTLRPGKWHRLVYVVNGGSEDDKNESISYYLDDQLVNYRTMNNMTDGRHSIDSLVKIGSDSQINNKNYELRRVVYYDYALSSDQVDFLALMSFEEFKVENNRSLEDGNTFIYFYRGVSDQDDPSIFITTFEEYENWRLQSSNDLVNWRNSGVINTVKDESGDEVYRTGLMTLDDKIQEQKLFYRVQAIE